MVGSRWLRHPYLSPHVVLRQRFVVFLLSVLPAE